MVLVALWHLAISSISAASADSSALSGPRWGWPTDSPTSVTRAFDPPAQPWLAGHRGVDLRLDVGAAVVSPVDGTVIYAGMLVNRHVVSVEHGNFRSSVEPVNPTVVVGQQVTRGQIIGYLEPSNAHDGLHWGVRLNRVYVDPLTLVVGPVVLKPI